jgi:hypothetical protein
VVLELGPASPCGARALMQARHVALLHALRSIAVLGPASCSIRLLLPHAAAAAAAACCCCCCGRMLLLLPPPHAAAAAAAACCCCCCCCCRRMLLLLLLLLANKLARTMHVQAGGWEPASTRGCFEHGWVDIGLGGSSIGVASAEAAAAPAPAHAPSSLCYII